MNARFTPKPLAPPGAIEFELVPVDAARAAHDQLPPGVEALPSLVPDYWPQRRRKPVPSDRAPAASIVSGVRRQNTLSSRPE